MAANISIRARSRQTLQTVLKQVQATDMAVEVPDRGARAVRVLKLTRKTAALVDERALLVPVARRRRGRRGAGGETHHRLRAAGSVSHRLELSLNLVLILVVAVSWHCI
jgi:hypothetical protein